MDTSILYRKGTRYLLIPFAIAFFVISILIGLLYGGYFNRIDVLFKQDNEVRLNDLSMQTVRVIEEKFKSNMKVLEQISSVLYNSEDLFSDQIIEYMKKKVLDIGAIRLNMVLPDGTAKAVTKEGTVLTGFNLGDRVHFKESMKGKNDTRFLPKARIDSQEIFVCSVPIYGEKGISGVLIGVYDLSSVEHLLNLQESTGSDFAFLVSNDGSLITGRDRSELDILDNNIFNSLNFNYLAERYSLEKIKKDMDQSLSGSLCMYFDGLEYTVAYNPVSFGNCYLFSIIPSVMLTRVSKKFINITIFIAVIEVIFILILGIFFALTYRKNRYDIYDLAFKDAVTAGGNNTWFRYEAEKILKNASKSSYALIILDIDNLKILNDTYGYDTGNNIINFVYNLVSNILTEGEILSRVMQDDFAILVKYISDKDIQNGLNHIVQKMNECNMASLGLDENYVISLSVGVYVIEDKGLNMLSIQDRAYMALNSAKKTQGSLLRYAFFQEKDRARLVEDKRIENRMEEALQNKEFIVHLQPKYDISTNKISGAEALVRWEDPERGLVSPGCFIPLFERNGFIYKLDLYVFEQVCILLRSELDRGVEPYTISVNLSRSYLNRPNFLDEFKNICKKYELSPKYLELELTESVMFENMDLLSEIINDMHDFGFTCSLDDFGSGYSSLNMLKSIPVDVLKLDREFFTEPEKTRARGSSVIESVILLAQKLNMKTVSEGVEKDWQIEFLREAKCDMVQGFIFSKPVSMEKYEEMAFEQ